MRGLPFCLTLFFFFLLPFGLGASNYSKLGDNAFFGGTGFFNEALPSYFTAVKYVSTPGYVPLVADLDGDGINEVIVFDGVNVRLYSPSLAVIDTYSGLENTYNFGQVLNMDADAYPEIVVNGDADNNISILQYNGTHFFREYFLTLSSQFSGTNDQVLSCDAGRMVCLLVGSGGSSTGYLYAQAFNASSVGAALQVTSTGGQGRCAPRIKYAEVLDIDNDATTEFIYSMFLMVAGTDSAEMRAFNVSSALAVANERTATVSLYSITDAGASCSAMNLGRYVTPPLCYDFDASPSNGKECVFGYMTAAGSYKFRAYSSNFIGYSTFPLLLSDAGELLGNVVRGPYLPDDANAFCLPGYKASTQHLNLACGTLVGGGLFLDNYEFTADLSQNIPVDFGNYNALITGAQMESVLFDGVDLYEIVASEGVYRLDWDSCSHVTGVCDLVNIWGVPQQNVTLVPVDAQKNGRADLLALTKNNVWYFDDGYSNSNPYLSYYYVNPCVTATWAVNTTAEIRLAYTDIDADYVSARAVLYCGSAYAQNSSWAGPAPSGTQFSLSGFKANVSVSTGKICFIGRDIYNHTVNNELFFSVASSGVGFGDCVTTGAPSANVSVNASVTVTATQKAEAQNVFSAGGTLPLIVGGFIFLLALVAGLAISLSKAGVPGNVNAVVTSIGAFFGWVILIVFGVIPVWTLVVAIIFCAALIGWKFYSGSGANIHN